MDAANNDGNLPLHWACRCGNLQVVKLMLETEYPEDEMKYFEDCRSIQTYKFICDLNATDNECRTSFYLSVANGHEKIVYYLVNFKIELFRENSEPIIDCPFALNIYCSNGRTALMTACANGNEEIVRILLDNDVDINLPIALTENEIKELHPMEEARCAGSGALVESVKSGNLKLVKLLLRKGALDYDNRALITAMKIKDNGIISLLLNQLTFIDTENVINKKISLDSTMLNSSNLISNIFPTNSIQLNWRGTTMDELLTDYLINSTMKFNPRIRQIRLALTAITKLDLSLNKLTIIPQIIFQLQSLQNLDLSQNLIQKIDLPTEEFTMPFLEIFNLESNFITSLPGVLFSKNFPNLKNLNISGNRLRLIPPIIWTSQKLKELNLSNNEILELCTVSLPGKSGGRKNVKEIHQDRAHKLKEKAALLKSAKNIPKEITIENNIIEQDIIRLNQWQKKVQLSNIDDLETDDKTDLQTNDIFTNSLKILNLSGNKLNSIPECLACCCPKLIKLDLSMNNISIIGPIECLPSSLRYLNLSHNRLTKMFTKPNSKNLICQSPKILENDEKQKHGTNRHSRSRSRSVARNQRSLSVTRITENEQILPEACPHKSHVRFEALKTLNLSYNELTQFELFVSFNIKNNFAALEQLNIKENIHEFRSYLIFPALTNLDVSYNSLKTIPSTISLLSYLAALNVSGNNELETLPNELGLLDKLWNVTLKDCPVKEPLKSIVYGDNYKTVDLIAFLRNRLEK